MTVYDTVVTEQARRLSTPERARVARAIVADHQGTAPRLTGAYADGATVVESGDDVSVVNRDDTAIYKEYGTSDTPAHGSMTNAARKYGRYSGWDPSIWMGGRR